MEKEREFQIQNFYFSDAIYYTRKGWAVVIHNLWPQDTILDEENLEMAIKDIKESKQFYSTEEAYQRMLSVYENALVFLRVEMNKSLAQLADELMSDRI